jgi:hypothetical protein
MNPSICNIYCSTSSFKLGRQYVEGNPPQIGREKWNMLGRFVLLFLRRRGLNDWFLTSKRIPKIQSVTYLRYFSVCNPPTRPSSIPEYIKQPGLKLTVQLINWAGATPLFFAVTVFQFRWQSAPMLASALEWFSTPLEKRTPELETTSHSSEFTLTFRATTHSLPNPSRSCFVRFIAFFRRTLCPQER